MASTPVLLDTDTLSAIMRRQPAALAKARGYLAEHGRFALSVITVYEVLRGLMAKGATRQIQTFRGFLAANDVALLTDEAVEKAAELYADLARQGRLVGDADIFIAAIAMVNHLGVATGNEAHFRRFQGLHVENWLKDSTS